MCAKQALICVMANRPLGSAGEASQTQVFFKILADFSTLCIVVATYSLQARNIAVTAEFFDSDAEGSIPLCRFYKKPGPPDTGLFCTRGHAAVLHHQEKPEFYEEVCQV